MVTARLFSKKIIRAHKFSLKLPLLPIFVSFCRLRCISLTSTFIIFLQHISDKCVIVYPRDQDCNTDPQEVLLDPMSFTQFGKYTRDWVYKSCCGLWLCVGRMSMN